MAFFPKSLRRKLVWGYIAAVVMIAAFMLLGWRNLGSLEQMVVAGDTVADLFDATLEVRRFEKNYFLYGTSRDHEELLSYLERAEVLLGRPELLLFTGPSVVGDLRQSVNEYKDMLLAGPGGSRSSWEGRIREKGKAIVTLTEKISGDRKTVKRETLRLARGHLVVGIGVLLVVVLAGGWMFHLELQERQGHVVRCEKLASLGTLVFGVAHELNNPLSNISTSCQILKEELDGGDREHNRELLDQIEAETDRARDVVGSLLEYSRTRERGRFQLSKAVRETLRLLRAEMPPRIAVVTAVPDEIELFADKQKIQQLLLNLVKNAADAIGDEGEIVISASAGPRQAQIEVRDNGAGMDRETLGRIFDPFFSSKKEGKGYGLGLFIVHNIVEEHEGSISVESEPGHGTLFIITLPMKES
jgi:signal transduction histidine kinase